jgi:hypothetical protein
MLKFTLRSLLRMCVWVDRTYLSLAGSKACLQSSNHHSRITEDKPRPQDTITGYQQCCKTHHCTCIHGEQICAWIFTGATPLSTHAIYYKSQSSLHGGCTTQSCSPIRRSEPSESVLIIRGNFLVSHESHDSFVLFFRGRLNTFEYPRMVARDPTVKSDATDNTQNPGLDKGNIKASGTIFAWNRTEHCCVVS